MKKELPKREVRARENIYGSDKKIRFKIGDIITDSKLVERLEEAAPSAVDTFQTINAGQVRVAYSDFSTVNNRGEEKKEVPKPEEPRGRLRGRGRPRK